MSIIFSNPNSPQTRIAVPPIIAQIDPVTGPGAQQYPLGQIWINTTSDVVFTLTSFSNGLATWVATAPASAGVFTSLSVTPGPVDLEGTVHIEGIDDVPEVIRLRENGGTSGTIEIASLQGTGSDSISIQSTSGGIQVTTNAASGDIAVTSQLGSVIIGSGEDIIGAIELLADGGTSSSVQINNASGTGAESIKLQSANGGIRMDSVGDVAIASTLGSFIVNAGEAIATAVYIEATDVVSGGVSIVSGGGGVLLDSENGTFSINTDPGTSGVIGIGNKTLGGMVTLESLTNITIDPVTSLTMAPSPTVTTIDIGNVALTTEDRTTTINGGDVAVQQLDVLNLASGDVLTDPGASKLVYIATGLTNVGNTRVDIGTGNVSGGGTHQIDISTGQGIKAVSMGNADNLTTFTTLGTVNVNSNALTTAITQTINLANGGLAFDAGASKIVNIATGNNSLGTTRVDIGTGEASSGTHEIKIGTGEGGIGTKNVFIGNVDALTTISEFGTVNINTSTSTGATTIGNAGAGGAIALTTNTTVGIDAKTASHFTVTGAADLTLNSTAGSVVINGGEAVADAIQLTTSNPAGGITAAVGSNNFNVSGGNIVMPTAGTGLTLTPAPATPASLLAGAGDPNGVVTAGLGSLYMNVTGSGVANRLWVNSDAADTWVAVTTVS